MSAFLTAEIRTLEGESVGVLVLRGKTFSTGNTGYHGQGKIEFAGQRYQAQVQLVAIGRKADDEALLREVEAEA